MPALKFCFFLILHHAVKIPILIFTHTLFKYYSLVHEMSHYSHAHSHDLFHPKGRIFLQKFVSFPCPWYIIPWKFGYSKFPFHKNVTEISLIVKFSRNSLQTLEIFQNSILLLLHKGLMTLINMYLRGPLGILNGFSRVLDMFLWHITGQVICYTKNAWFNDWLTP